MLKERGLKIKHPELTHAIVDHVIPTDCISRPFADHESELMTKTLEDNVKEFGITYFEPGSGKQGVCHVSYPEQGLIWPGITAVCGDSHTCTYGAFGALSFGIGTTQVSHVLATQTMAMDPLKVKRINFNGKLKKANLGFVQFSLDGTPEIHNDLRGKKDTFQKAISAAVFAKELSIKTQFNTVLTSTNLNSIDYIIDIGLKYGIELHFRRFVPVGFGQDNKHLIPNYFEYKKAIIKLLELKESLDIPILIEEPLIALWSKNKNIPQIGCGAGITQLGIDTDGNIYPCIFYRQSVGNILKDNFIDIWKNSELLNNLRSRNYGICSSCDIKNSCGACNACTPNQLGVDLFCSKDEKWKNLKLLF